MGLKEAGPPFNTALLCSYVCVHPTILTHIRTLTHVISHLNLVRYSFKPWIHSPTGVCLHEANRPESNLEI